MIAATLAHKGLTLTVMLLMLCGVSALAADQMVVKGLAIAHDSAGPLPHEAVLQAAATVARLASRMIELYDAFLHVIGTLRDLVIVLIEFTATAVLVAPRM